MSSRFKKRLSMQYRGLLVLTFAVIAWSADAQVYEDFTLAAQNRRIIHTDTLVNKNGSKNLPPAIAAEKLPMPAMVNGKKPVPLAGQKSYFGSMNEYVVNYTKEYMESHNKTLEVVKKRGEKNFSVIDDILEQNQIPKELKYLAVIESALNHNARSPVGAVGPWQLMAGTARMLGLTVNRKRDDRRNLEKSTNAAARYLSYLYDELNDWLLVVAAYNSGPAPVKRAMERTGSNNFWDIKKYLPRETQRHVLKFIATASIFENMNKVIGLEDLPEDVHVAGDVVNRAKILNPAQPSFSEEELKNMAIVRIDKPLYFDLLVQELKIDRDLLKKWNPDYGSFESSTYKGDFYSLRIPKDKLDNFIERKEFLSQRSEKLYAELSF